MVRSPVELPGSTVSLYSRDIMVVGLFAQYLKNMRGKFFKLTPRVLLGVNTPMTQPIQPSSRTIEQVSQILAALNFCDRPVTIDTSLSRDARLLFGLASGETSDEES